MEQFGTALVLSEALFTLLQESVCKVNASQISLCEVNDLRYQLVRVKKGDVDSSQLPLCQDTIMLQAMRANYQACIWKRMFRTRNGHPKPRGTWMDGKMVFDLMHSECHSHVNVSIFDYDPAELAELRYNYIFHFRMSELYVCIFVQHNVTYVILWSLEQWY